MKLNVHPHHFQELLEKGYSLDLIYVLKMVNSGYDLTEMRASHPKIDALFSTLVRKELIGDAGITIKGQELLKFMDSKIATKITKTAETDEEFRRWWIAYPGTNTFTYNGVDFKGDRALRVKKDDCRAKLHNILQEGEYTIDELIGALEYEVKQKQQRSYEEKTNKMKYMQNSLTYLNQRTFEPFIELIKKGAKIEEKQSVGGTDI